MACLIIGNGLFKPNISTLLGNLYKDMPEKRDDAYNIFYMGINLGAFISPLVAAYLRNNYGWHYAFGAAGIGMVISLIIFTAFKKHYVAGDVKEMKAAAASWVEFTLTKKQERDRLRALLLVFGIVIIFWMAFEQNGFTLTFWARDNTDTSLSPELFQSVNPVFVLLFTPLLVAVWTFFRNRGKEPSTAAKIGIGMLITAGAYGIMTVAGLVGGNIGKVNVAWLVSTYAVITTAELCLSPMGLSLVSKLAPARMRGMMMGGWFVASAAGSYLAGLVGGLWDTMPHSSFFLIMVVASLAAAGIFFTVIKHIRPIIHEAEQMALQESHANR